ncbi:conserved hypothetical protein [Coccidioides posadasii str. Silveira]|uniref:Uncharacterized protein n=1 Tax=Coccidioides posadasii (strain RMSCC 757 / Silveira) TaxID=443226 RepID=E9D6C4_COCPS|nr:conserved hypothetical protein [Coccidioides posadasii str. Silveira]
MSSSAANQVAGSRTQPLGYLRMKPQHNRRHRERGNGGQRRDWDHPLRSETGHRRPLPFPWLGISDITWLDSFVNPEPSAFSYKVSSDQLARGREMHAEH